MKQTFKTYHKIEINHYITDLDGITTISSTTKHKCIKHHLKQFNTYKVEPLLTGSAFKYLCFIKGDIDSNNEFSTNQIKRLEFINQLNAQLNTKYNTKFVAVVLNELRSLGFVYKRCQGLYILNPFLYWQGSDINQLKAFKLIIDTNNQDQRNCIALLDKCI